MECELCGSSQEDRVQHGQFYTMDETTVHINCLFFSSNMIHREANGSYSILAADIVNRRQIFNDRTCCYCKKSIANISCNRRKCQRTFHFNCGVQNGARNQFVPPFRSYCHRHVKLPKCRPSENERCCICYEDIFEESTGFLPGSMLHSPCCRNYWFHKLCLQKYAYIAGNLFKCPICKNSNEFLPAMRYWGVCVEDFIQNVYMATQLYATVQRRSDLLRTEYVIRYREERPAVDQGLILDEFLMRQPQQLMIDDNQRQQDEDEMIRREQTYAQRLRRFIYNCLYERSYFFSYKRTGIKWLSWFANNVFTHPFIMLRQQCQVNSVAHRFHLQPFSLAPIIIQLYSQQGAKTFFKGFCCCYFFKGLSKLIGNDISKGEVSFYTCIIRQCVKAAMLGLKRTCLMSTVASLVIHNDSSINCEHQLSFRSLFFPYLCIESAKYKFRATVKCYILDILRKKRITSFNSMEIETRVVRSDLISHIITEVTFFPLETIMHRLLLQGTETIIDNLDDGISLKPILTYYKGVRDCYSTIVNTEGYSGFYKGFGALIMQFSIHAIVLKVGLWICS